MQATKTPAKTLLAHLKLFALKTSQAEPFFKKPALSLV